MNAEWLAKALTRWGKLSCEWGVPVKGWEVASRVRLGANFTFRTIVRPPEPLSLSFFCLLVSAGAEDAPLSNG